VLVIDNPCGRWQRGELEANPVRVASSILILESFQAKPIATAAKNL
jgi:hypothetical protein